SKNLISKSSSGRIQIKAPSIDLLDHEDEDSDSEERNRKRFKRSEAGSRLISILPKPKGMSTPQTSSRSSSSKPATLTSLIPNSVANRTKTQIPIPKESLTSKLSAASATNSFLSDDSDDE